MPAAKAKSRYISDGLTSGRWRSAKQNAYLLLTLVGVDPVKKIAATVFFILHSKVDQPVAACSAQGNEFFLHAN